MGFGVEMGHISTASYGTCNQRKALVSMSTPNINSTLERIVLVLVPEASWRLRRYPGTTIVRGRGGRGGRLAVCRSTGVSELQGD